MHPKHPDQSIIRETLGTSFQLNRVLTLKNRILMAPMTRNMANADLAPTNAMADYYAKRAEAGLIISEGILIDQYAGAYTNVPGLYSEKQVAGWKRVVDRVHANGGLIFAQIWHVGRVSHPLYCGGKPPIAPSATQMTGDVRRSVGLKLGLSREATISEINELVAMYARAAANAKKAGFDGVEIHGANGYLIDQFLHCYTNHRTDQYGGTPANMARFAIEVIDACADSFGSYERIGLRLTPGTDYSLNEMVGDPNDKEVFVHLLSQLNNFPQKLAYVHTGTFNDKEIYPVLGNITMTQFLRTYYQGTVIACGGYTAEEATDGISNNAFNLVAIGRPFIANHDYVTKVFSGQSLEPYDVKTLTTILDPSKNEEEENSPTTSLTYSA